MKKVMLSQGVDMCMLLTPGIALFHIQQLHMQLKMDLTTYQVSFNTALRLYSFLHAQLSMTFILLINVKMPTIVGILTYIIRINYWL